MTISAVRLDANAVDVTVTDDQMVVVLADGRELAAPLAWFPRLLKATPDQRKKLAAHWRRTRHPLGRRGRRRLDREPVEGKLKPVAE
jgi:hypothetical protein